MSLQNRCWVWISSEVFLLPLSSHQYVRVIVSEVYCTRTQHEDKGQLAQTVNLRILSLMQKKHYPMVTMLSLVLILKWSTSSDSRYAPCLFAPLLSCQFPHHPPVCFFWLRPLMHLQPEMDTKPFCEEVLYDPHQNSNVLTVYLL